MRDLAFLASWLVLVPIVTGGADLAVMLWAWTSLLAPNDLLFGIGVAVPFAKIAAILAGLVLVVRPSQVQFRLGPIGWLLLALAAGSIISQSLSIMADPDPGWDLCQKYLKIIALALMVLWVITNRIRVHGLLLAICLGMGYIGVDEGAKFLLSGSGHKVLGSVSLGDNNQVALDVLLIIPLLQYLYSTAASRMMRLACGSGILLSVVAVIATFSRGGFLGLMIVGAGSVIAGRRKGLNSLMLAVALLAGGAFVGSDWTARMSTVQDAKDDGSFMGRVIAWKVSTALALERPFLGGGFHAIQHRDVWLGQAHGFQELSAIPTDEQGDFPRAAHSIYFEVLGDLGFTGLACFMALLGLSWHEAGVIRRLVRQSGRADLVWAADLAGKLRVSLTTFLVSGALLSAAYYDIDYLLIGLVGALRFIVQRALKEEPQEARARRLQAMRGRPAPAFARQLRTETPVALDR